DQEGSLAKAARAGSGGVVRKTVTETLEAARFSGLEDGELLAPYLGPILHRMPALNPGKVVGEYIGVLQFHGRQEGGAAQGRRAAIVKVQLGQATIDRGKRHAQEAHLARDVLIEIELEAVRVDPVVTEAELVHQGGPEDVGL